MAGGILKHFRGYFDLKIVLVVTPLLFLMTACRQEQLSLPIAHAAGAQPHAAVEKRNQPAPEQSCYAFILLRPRAQRASAVQARLAQADRMAAAFDPHLVSVDIVGDHANVLSLQFPVAWPANPAYFDRVTSIVDEYFAAPDVEDYMCNSGFAQVRLSARGLNDRRIHPIWTAQVTSVGLLKDASDDDQVAASEPLSLR